MSPYSYVDGHPVGRTLPIPKKARDRAIGGYVTWRNLGADHPTAIRHAKDICGLSPLVMILLSVAFQVLWALLKKWWDNRNAGDLS